MRPGQEAPDEGFHLAPMPGLSDASMRPGQEAPDERQGLDALELEWHSFNEAGARSPG